MVVLLIFSPALYIAPKIDGVFKAILLKKSWIIFLVFLLQNDRASLNITFSPRFINSSSKALAALLWPSPVLHERINIFIL